MILDPLKSSIQNILDLMNADNNRELTMDQVAIGAPEVFEDPEGVNPRNTQIVVSAVEGSTEFKGKQTLRYTRLALAVLGANVSEFQSDAETTLADVKAAVVAELGLIAEDVEFVEAAMPEWEDEMIDGETAPLTLRARADSHAYVGDLIVTVIEPIDGRERMAEVFAVSDLSGFDVAVEEEVEDEQPEEPGV